MKIGLVGNPNVGKSTIFNALTGMHQHTGNWPGKTVAKASGYKKYKGINYLIEDLPGTYSLMAHSKEEEVTRDFIYSGDYDALIVVCDAVCLERNLNLVLQILEITNKVVLCVNLMDEAKKKKINIDLSKLSKILKIPVVPATARSGKGLEEIMENLSKVITKENSYYQIKYNEYLEAAIEELKIFVSDDILNKDVVCLNFLTNKINTQNYKELSNDKIFLNKLKEVKRELYKKGIKDVDIETLITEEIVTKATTIAHDVITYEKEDYQKRDRLIDKINEGYDVVFNYIIKKKDLEEIKKVFKGRKIKFVVLMADKEELIRRDKKRIEENQMKERTIELLKSFENEKFNKDNILDTSNMQAKEVCMEIIDNNRFEI